MPRPMSAEIRAERTATQVGRLTACLSRVAAVVQITTARIGHGGRVATTVARAIAVGPFEREKGLHREAGLD